MENPDNKNLDIFFALLRSGMYGMPIPESELPESIDWESIINFAQKHVVYGIIIESVRFLPEELLPTGTIAAKMNKFALGLIQTNVILDKTVVRLSDFLKSHNISGVLLKGAGVARYYNMPQIRQSGDIDFYVGKSVYKKAVAVCQELIKNKRTCHETEQHFDFYMDGVLIELHRLATRLFSPFKNKQFQNWIVTELEQSSNRRTLKIGNSEITLPSVDFDVIYIFYHAWRHFITGGIGFRQLCDWAMILQNHGDKIDKEQLKENLNRFGITKGWKLFACIAVNQLGVSAEKIPLYDPEYSRKSEKVLEDIIDGGNFGYYSKAFLRTKGQTTHGLRYSLNKLRSYTGYFFFLLPIIPMEAIFMYLSRTYNGASDCIKMYTHKSDR